MRHDAPYFRNVAAQCRLLSEETRDRPTAKMLVQMAEDFEEESRLIEIEERQESKRREDEARRKRRVPLQEAAGLQSLLGFSKGAAP